MDEQTLEKLRLFIRQGNADLLHPLDWERFYDFMLAAFEDWESFDHDMVGRVLIEGGFSEEKALDLVDFCEQSRGLLGYVKKPRRPT